MNPKASILAMGRHAPYDDVVKRMALAASLKLQPFDGRARQSERLGACQQGEGKLSADLGLKLSASWTRRSWT